MIRRGLLIRQVEEPRSPRPRDRSPRVNARDMYWQVRDERYQNAGRDREIQPMKNTSPNYRQAHTANKRGERTVQELGGQ